MLLNPANLVFVGCRIDQSAENWQMPQGGIDEGEDPRTAAMREMYEEIGTNKAEIIAESREWLNYDLPPDLIPRVWGGRYRGQKQKWFACRFTGTDRDIVLDRHKPEFNAWKWAPMTEIARLIVPFKRPLYTQILAEFQHLGIAVAE